VALGEAEPNSRSQHDGPQGPGEQHHHEVTMQRVRQWELHHHLGQLWDLARLKRRTSLSANSFFMSVICHPDESQVVTTGTDRKVGVLQL
jgi:hypothetical protein